MSHDVFLIRHGAAAAAWSEALDPGLSDEGREHARLVAAHFASHPPCPLVASPLARARETAEPLAAVWRRPMTLDERVREVPSSVPMDERKAWLGKIMASTWPEVDASLHAWRDQAARAVLGFRQDTLVFTHFMVINALVARATDDQRLVCFEPDYGSITQFRCDGDALSLVSLGRARKTLVNL